MGHLNLKHLRYFFEVARHGSIAEASRSMGTSPSTISEQLRALEGSLGQPLFLRSSQGLRLTEAGQVVMQQAELIFESVDRMMGYFRASQPPGDTVLRVGNASSLARSQTASNLLPLVGMQDVRVRVETSTPERLVRALVDGELDLVLSDAEPPRQFKGVLESEPLRGSPLVVVVGPDHGKATQEGVDYLRSVPLLQYMVSSRHRWDVEEWLREHDLHPTVLGEVDDVTLLLAAARAGLCFAVVPQAALVDAGMGLHVVCRIGEHARTECYAIYRGGEPLERVRSAVSMLRDSGD